MFSNFNLSYLKSKLGKNFVPLNEAEIKLLKEKRDKVYEKDMDICVDEIYVPDINLSDDFASKKLRSDEIYKISEILLSKNESLFNRFYDEFLEFCENEQNNFNRKIVFKLLLAFKDFLYSGANSAVFFLSRNLKNDNISLWEKYYNKEFLEKFAKMLNFNVEIYSLKAKDFHDKNDEKEATNGEFANTKKELENGKRVAIFTTYQALGVGQNIQYKFDPKKIAKFNKNQ